MTMMTMIMMKIDPQLSVGAQPPFRMHFGTFSDMMENILHLELVIPRFPCGISCLDSSCALFSLI